MVNKKKNTARRTTRPAPTLRGILKKPGRARAHHKTNRNRNVRFNTNPRRRGPGYSPNRRKTVKGIFKKRRPTVRRAHAPKLRGILKKPGRARAHHKTNHNRNVRFNTNPRGRGPGYSPGRRKLHKGSLRQTRKRAKLSKSTLKAAKLRHGAKRAKNLRKAKKVHKYVKAAKVVAAGTGVGAVAGLAASAAGLDPTELAMLKATDPAAYRRKMRALKKNPVKYVGKNIAGNVKKVGQGAKKLGRKVGGVFKKKKRRNRR